MRILIATDGSKEATTALETANRLLSTADRRLDLLCVTRKARRKAGGKAGGNGHERRAVRQITHILERARVKLQPDAQSIHVTTETGSPETVIVKRAEDYDLTVVGSKDRRAGGETGLGPVASRVVEQTLGPVLVARPLRSEEGMRVLAAVDGSTASRHAIETMGELFDLTGSDVCLMHVAETPWVETVPGEDWATYSEEDKEKSATGELEQELVREGETVIEQARELLRPYRGVAVSTQIVEGNPANEILSEAERGQYDLIVTGAAGGRDLKHSILGSVSAKIAWNAACSVLIVREPEPE